MGKKLLNWNNWKINGRLRVFKHNTFFILGLNIFLAACKMMKHFIIEKIQHRVDISERFTRHIRLLFRTAKNIFVCSTVSVVLSVNCRTDPLVVSETCFIIYGVLFLH